MRRIPWILLALWPILCIGALSGFLYDVATLEGQNQRWVRSELEEKLSLQLLVLNLPISVAAVAIGPILPDLGEGVVAEWSLLVFLGFVQWTLLLPAAIRRLRSISAGLRETDGT